MFQLPISSTSDPQPFRERCDFIKNRITSGEMQTSQGGIELPVRGLKIRKDP